MSINPKLLNQTPPESDIQTRIKQTPPSTPSTPYVPLAPAPTFGSMLSSNASSRYMISSHSLSGALSAFGGRQNTKKGPKEQPKKKKKKKGSGPQDEDGLLAGLFKIFLAVLQIPTKFEKLFEGVTNAGLALATGLEGITESTFLGIEDLVYLAIVMFTIASKYANCVISFIVNLPGCFISHVITCIFSVLYLIFPLTAWIFWMLTDIDLMPYFDAAFEVIYDGDDMFAKIIGFNFLKFPPSIIKQCYTCNGKVVKLRDILKDVMKIKDVGDKISFDMTKRVPRFMKPAMPHIYKTANAVDQVFFQ